MKAIEAKELILEVVKDGYRRLVYRQVSENGNVIYLEESDIIDFSRPISDNGDYNVFFSKRELWKSLTEFTSNEGLLKRQVWHQKTNEWLALNPIFVHQSISSLVQESLSLVLKNLTTQKPEELEGVRNWLRAVSTSRAKSIHKTNSFKQLRYAV